jgi:uncharacterized membrane protein
MIASGRQRLKALNTPSNTVDPLELDPSFLTCFACALASTRLELLEEGFLGLRGEGAFYLLSRVISYLVRGEGFASAIHKTLLLY